ncbi:hypothetical protein R1sor_003064 [Riccia sorocarpa]|uniref:Transmembrane protein n=1 Tax=Riccia sorocarpa TaxID=122646 RepID=A0ABD3H3L4_9MARC
MTGREDRNSQDRPNIPHCFGTLIRDPMETNDMHKSTVVVEEPQNTVSGEANCGMRMQTRLLEWKPLNARRSETNQGAALVLLQKEISSHASLLSIWLLSGIPKLSGALFYKRMESEERRRWTRVKSIARGTLLLPTPLALAVPSAIIIIMLLLPYFSSVAAAAASAKGIWSSSPKFQEFLRFFPLTPPKDN